LKLIDSKWTWHELAATIYVACTYYYRKAGF
jgi:hypothetical protein